jgi:hypothetical protein
MANNLRSMINVIANDEAIAELERRVELARDNDSIAAFAKAFYDNVELSENGGVMNSWSLDNLGSKWTYLSDNWGGGEFIIESAWYRPKEFFIHLYKLMAEIDPEVVIEVKYEDEGYNPIGAVVIKKDMDGTPCYWEEEDDEMEDPTIDMDWDDEEYEQTQMDFMDEIAERQDELLAECHELVVSDGEPIYEMESEDEEE